MDPITFAVGDVHGCSEQLGRLLGAIETYAAGRARKIVFLGDYIDKGPDSAGAIGMLMRVQQRDPENVVCIRGNHDDLLLRAALGDELASAKWMTMDGGSVLKQFGVSDARDLPVDVIDWFEALPFRYSDEHRHYVHAGLVPGVPLEDQTKATCLTMRGAFLDRDFDFGKHVVHGHTPQVDGMPDLRPFRTNLDTNVVQTKRLTAAAFEARPGPPATIIATRPSGDVAVSPHLKHP